MKTILYVSVERKEWYTRRSKNQKKKNVECTFGVLKSKRGIIKRLTRDFKQENIIKVMYACCILYNMILKYEGQTLSLVHIRDPEKNEEDGVDSNVY